MSRNPVEAVSRLFSTLTTRNSVDLFRKTPVSRQINIDGEQQSSVTSKSDALLGLLCFAGTVLLCVQAYTGRNTNRGPRVGDSPGRWGQATANSDYCEANYAISYYVSEFWNSLSSLLICGWGVLGFWFHRRLNGRPMEWRFCLAFGGFIVVGLGSCLFHATLLRHWQLADQLPMLWSNFVLLYVNMAMFRKVGEQNLLLKAVLLLLGIASTLAIVLTPRSQGLFLMSYGAGVIHLVILYYRNLKSHNPAGSYLLVMGMCCYLFGFIIWNIERVLCSQVQSLQLHAWWHVLAASGNYMCVLFWLQCRQKALSFNTVVASHDTPLLILVEAPKPAS